MTNTTDSQSKEFKGVSYRSDLNKPMNPGRGFDNQTREADIGTLKITADSIEFQARKKSPVVISSVHSITVGKKAFWEYVCIEYGDGLTPKTAYFGGARTLGGKLLKRKTTKDAHQALEAFARTHQAKIPDQNDSDSATQWHAIETIAKYVAECDQKGWSETDIRSHLGNMGLSTEHLALVTQGIKEFKHPLKSSLRNLGIGLIFLIVGVIITIGSYQMASDNGGGTYVVAWGAVIWGALQALAGLSGYFSTPKGQQALEDSVKQALSQNVSVAGKKWDLTLPPEALNNIAVREFYGMKSVQILAILIGITGLIILIGSFQFTWYGNQRNYPATLWELFRGHANGSERPLILDVRRSEGVRALEQTLIAIPMGGIILATTGMLMLFSKGRRRLLMVVAMTTSIILLAIPFIWEILSTRNWESNFKGPPRIASRFIDSRTVLYSTTEFKILGLITCILCGIGLYLVMVRFNEKRTA